MTRVVGTLATGAPIVEDLLPAGGVAPYRYMGDLIQPQGLVLHDTETPPPGEYGPGATAEAIRNGFLNSHNSAHVVVDWEKALVLVPWEPGQAREAFHAKDPVNSHFLGVELCTAPNDRSRALKAYHNWTAMAAHMMAAYRWPATPGITGATYSGNRLNDVCLSGACHPSARLWTHNWVSYAEATGCLYPGYFVAGKTPTTHTDPVGYLASIDITPEQMQRDIALQTGFNPSLPLTPVLVGVGTALVVFKHAAIAKALAGLLGGL